LFLIKGSDRNIILTHAILCLVFVTDYTFTVLDTACCGGGQFGAEYGCNFSAPLCPNRSNHLFWDDYHPTEALSQLAAKIIFGDPSRLYVHPINVQQLVGGGAATLENI
jgi:hypothetical protein